METCSAKILTRMIHFPVLTLGPGARVGIWLRGCTIHCEGCISKELWDFDPASARDVCGLINEITEFFKKSPPPDGVTISGGEPFDQGDALIFLLRGLRSAGIQDILIYSGYRKDCILSKYPETSLLASALVDSPFQFGNETECGWKGSENQTLTVFDRNFSLRYDEWRNIKKGRLQIANVDGHIVCLGIPRQADVTAMADEIVSKIRIEDE
jgi:anaerobic ribonucleoside-triphosphate reductase activating protein